MSIGLDVRSRRAVGSLIGIGFLLMILAMGFSFYEIVNRIERSSAGTLLEMAALERDAADENIDIQRVRLTGVNSLNLTIKNTGNILAGLEWIGVFDETSNTQDYYKVDTSLSSTENQTDIGNATIVMNPANTYTIQVLTKLGNAYYGEYPEPVTTGGGGSGGGGSTNETQYFYVDHVVDSQAPTALGSHSLFSAMQAGPDEIFDILTEGVSSGTFEGFINNTIVDSLEFDILQGKTPRMIPITGDVYAIVYAGNGDDGFLKTVEINTNGIITNTVIDTLEFDASTGKTPYILPVSGDVYAIVYEGPGTDGFLVTVEIASNGQITNALIDTLEFDTLDGFTPTITHISGEIYAIDYAGDLNDGFLKTIHFLSSGGDYRLDLEVDWAGLPSKTNEYLSIYGGIMGAETLLVDYWDGGSWVNLFPSISSGWNIVDVSGVLTGATFTIRFVDGTQVSDAVQDAWEIDFVYLNLFD